MAKVSPIVTALRHAPIPSCICIRQDSADAPVAAVFRLCLESCLTTCDSVTLVCVNRSPSFYNKNIPMLHKATVIDWHTDPSWISETDAANATTHTSGARSLLALDNKICESLPASAPSESASAVIFDSMSELLFQHGDIETCQFLHTMQQRFKQVLFVLRMYCHDQRSAANILRLPQLVVVALPPEFSGAHGTCSVLHRQQRGKVSTKLCHWCIKDGSFVHIADVTHGNKAVVSGAAANSSDAPPVASGGDGAKGEQLPTDLSLPFRLELSEGERNARASVLLPYQTHLHGRGVDDKEQIDNSDGGEDVADSDDEADVGEEVEEDLDADLDI